MDQVYYHMDTLFLGLMRTDAEVGRYTAAYKIILVTYALGGAFPQMVFPALARAFHEGEAQARQVFGFALRITLLAAFPIAAGGALLADDMLRWIYAPDYAPAGPAFRVLLATLFFMLAGNLYGSTVLACDRQRRYLVVVTVGAVLNTVLNLILIRRYGMLGAAGATLATEVVVFCAMHASLPAGFGGLLPAAAWRPALATAGMGALIVALRPVSAARRAGCGASGPTRSRPPTPPSPRPGLLRTGWLASGPALGAGSTSCSTTRPGTARRLAWTPATGCRSPRS